MTRSLLLAAAGWAALLGGAGCVTCKHESLEASLCPTDPCPGDCVHRGHVHLVIVNGYDVLDFSGMSQLREAVNAAGFPKVHIGHPCHHLTLTAEVRRAWCNDPDARFVFVGFDLGAGDAEALAGYAATLGAAVDAVVLLDPAYLTTPVEVPPGLVVVRSEGWTAGRPATSTLPGVGHLSLPTHPHVIGTITDLMRTSLSRVPLEEPTSPTLPLVDDPAPIPFLPVGKPATKPAAPAPPAEPIPAAPKRQVPGVLTNATR